MFSIAHTNRTVFVCLIAEMRLAEVRVAENPLAKFGIAKEMHRPILQSRIHYCF